LYGRFNNFPVLVYTLRWLPFTLIFFYSCSLWDYEDPSDPYDNTAPETYLSLIASDTIYAHIDSLSGEVTYAIDEEPSVSMVWDTLDHAFTTITTSKQLLHWWGEDSDGDVIGYKYKWSSDSAWMFTTAEEGLFYVPIRTDLDVFSFEVKTVDNDSLEDKSPAKLTLPIKNSSPEIQFRFNSNPKIADVQGDTSFTFPTRTFVWDLYDQDGIESIQYIYYAMDDTCETCWIALDDASQTSITLTEIEPGSHVFYIRAVDVAGSQSNTIYFPDSSNTEEPNYWKVKPVIGEVLLIDDFSQDTQNNALNWYKGILDSLVGTDNYSIWELGKALPYSSNDIKATLGYFNSVFWNGGYSGTVLYDGASTGINNYILSGGNLFISVATLKDTTFSWFPIDSIVTLTEIWFQISPNRTLVSQVDSILDLRTPDEQGIYTDVKGFENESDPNFKSLYRLQLPEDQFDEWVGTPNVCGVYQFSYPTSSGKAVLLTLPLHNGYDPLLDGNNNFQDFLEYLLSVEFVE